MSLIGIFRIVFIFKEWDFDISIVHHSGEDQKSETTQFEERPISPYFTKDRIRPDSMNDQVSKPNARSSSIKLLKEKIPYSFEECSVNSREGVGDQHTIAIIEQNSNHEDQNDNNNQRLSAHTEEGIISIFQGVMRHSTKKS